VYIALAQNSPAGLSAAGLYGTEYAGSPVSPVILVIISYNQGLTDTPPIKLPGGLYKGLYFTIVFYIKFIETCS
jgi:hypothetical protein